MIVFLLDIIQQGTKDITIFVAAFELKNAHLLILRPIHRPRFVLGRKRPIHYVDSVELTLSIAIIMYGK